MSYLIVFPLCIFIIEIVIHASDTVGSEDVSFIFIRIIMNLLEIKNKLKGSSIQYIHKYICTGTLMHIF